MGRPSIYTEKLALELCRRMAEGKSLKQVCKAVDMPNMSTVLDWLGQPEKAEFTTQYTRAREACIQHMADDILLIAEEPCADMVAVQKQKLRIDTRRWLLSKLAPKKYGDNATLAIGNKDGETFRTSQSVDLAITSIATMMRAQARLSAEEREAIIDQRDPEDYV